MQSPIDPEMVTDKFMYRIVLGWELDSIEAHCRSFISIILDFKVYLYKINITNEEA